jgi:serine protease Do
MTDKTPNSPLSLRRKALIASVATFGVVAVLATGSLMSVPSSVAAQTATTAVNPPVAGVPSTAQPANAQTFSFADMVERVKPAVVSIRVKSVSAGPQLSMQQQSPDDDQNGPLERFFREFRNRRGGAPNAPDQGDSNTQMSQGSGFIITPDGKVVTNYHVVKDAREVTVVADDGTEYKAKVLGSDEKTDVAVVQIDGKGKTFPTVPFASSSIRVGDWVLAVGNPFGLGGTVTAGIVSARGREIGSGPYDDFLQIDAPINHGNSGGPTFNLAGEVVGMNTAIFSPSGGSVGIGFAIPTETIQRVVAQLEDGHEVVRGWLGVQIQPVTPDIADSLGMKEARGALVSESQGSSPATKAGIKAGDAIIAVDGKPVKGPRDLARTIAGYEPGANVKIAIFRDGKQQDIPVVLGKLPTDQKLAELQKSDNGDVAEPTSLATLGLSVAPSSDVGNGSEGVTVVRIDPKGAATQKNIKVGDVILEAQGHSVSTAADLTAALKEAKKDGRKAVLLRVKSANEAAHFVPLPIAAG